MRYEQSGRGKVYLVGAGPGDAELITVKGLRCLRAADVVIYDNLVNVELLEEAPLDAQRIFVGKKPGCHSMKQEEINALLIRYAKENRVVVRLKGGDPFVFGRGGEEALALAEEGIPFEIVPGVSSAIAVPAYAGIPVTHRDHTSLVTIVTGHEQHNNSSAGVDWETLAKLGGTLVIMMGVSRFSHIAHRLLNGGMEANTPVAVIQQGTLPQQRMVKGTLIDIVERAERAGIKSPAITIIGDVVNLSDPLAWFEARHALGELEPLPTLQVCLP